MANSNPNQKVTDEQAAALDALRLKAYGEPSSKYIKFEDGVPITLAFTDWSKKDEDGNFANMWEEEAESQTGTYKVAVFRVLDMTTDKQQEKLLSVSSKRLFRSLEVMLKRGFVVFEITQHKGATQFDTTYDVIPVGGMAKNE